LTKTIKYTFKYLFNAYMHYIPIHFGEKWKMDYFNYCLLMDEAGETYHCDILKRRTTSTTYFSFTCMWVYLMKHNEFKKGQQLKLQKVIHPNLLVLKFERMWVWKTLVDQNSGLGSWPRFSYCCFDFSFCNFGFNYYSCSLYFSCNFYLNWSIIRFWIFLLMFPLSFILGQKLFYYNP